MDYLKHILKTKNIDVSNYEVFIKIYEMLSNQQELKNITKLALSILPLDGNVSLIQFTNGKFDVVGHLGDIKEINSALEERSILKHVKDNKKPYFNHLDDKYNGFDTVLPIVSKDDFLGALAIHTKQDINCWSEISVILNLMSFIFKYYKFIEDAKELGSKDIISGLYNVRYFQDLLEIEIDKAKRYHIPLTLILIDIEDFKKINDLFGHEEGDKVLKQVGKWILTSTRLSDMPVRLEADKFAILLNNTVAENAHFVTDRMKIKSNLHKFNINHKEFNINLKTSITPYEKGLAGDELLKRGFNNLN